MAIGNKKFKYNDWNNLPDRHDGFCCRCGAKIKTKRLMELDKPICEWCWMERPRKHGDRNTEAAE